MKEKHKNKKDQQKNKQRQKITRRDRAYSERVRAKWFSCVFKKHFAVENANLPGKLLVSYDVNSLFTNIPLQETIDITTNPIFNHNPNLNITKKT